MKKQLDAAFNRACQVPITDITLKRIGNVLCAREGRGNNYSMVSVYTCEHVREIDRLASIISKQ